MSDRPLRLLLPLIASALLAVAIAHPALAWSHVSVEAPPDAEGCEAIRVRFGDVAAVRDVQTLAVAGGTPLRLHAPSSVGVRVTGWDRADFEITACKAARDAEALSRISVSAPRGVVSVSGVDGDTAALFFHVKAPRGATLDLAAENGPMGLRDLEANVSARVTNGPISFSRVRGAVTAEAENGPVSLRGVSGDWNVKVTNGPLSARFAGTRWEGKGLVAETVNGPLTVRLDPRFDSALRVSGPGHSPFRCRATACADARRSSPEDEGDERVVEIGRGEPSVRLSTVNGPVTISDDAADAD